MKPAQVYETTIFDRESGAGLTFVTLPLAALRYPNPSEAFEGISTVLKFQPVEGLIFGEERERNRLAAALDAMLAYPFEVRALGERVPPSEFAAYIANEATIPIEQSSVGEKTLVEILSSGGVAYGIARGRPLTILMGLGAIILIGPAEVIGQWGTAKLRELLDVHEPPD